MAEGEGPCGNGTAPDVRQVERLLVPLLDVLTLLLGLAGHSLVVLILTRRRRRGQGGRSSGTDTLLLALSGADLLLLCVLPFHTAAAAMCRWPFGGGLCRVVSFVGAACSSASAFTLAALAGSRFLTVVHPRRAYRLLTPHRLRLTAGALWAPAAALAAPQLAFRDVMEHASDHTSCFDFLPHAGQLAYGACHFLLAFALPLGVIAVAYLRIFLFLRRSCQSGCCPQAERYQSQVTQTSALLVLAFALCWLPSYGLMFALLRDRTSGTWPRYGAFSIFARLMANLSTVANPILYVFMSHKFRSDLVELGKRGARSCCC